MVTAVNCDQFRDDSHAGLFWVEQVGEHAEDV